MNKTLDNFTLTLRTLEFSTNYCECCGYYSGYSLCAYLDDTLIYEFQDDEHLNVGVIFPEDEHRSIGWVLLEWIHDIKSTECEWEIERLENLLKLLEDEFYIDFRDHDTLINMFVPALEYYFGITIDVVFESEQEDVF